MTSMAERVEISGSTKGDSDCDIVREGPGAENQAAEEIHGADTAGMARDWLERFLGYDVFKARFEKLETETKHFGGF